MVNVDVDVALEGSCALKFMPRLPVDMLEIGKITAELQGSVNLETNQSLNVFLKPALKDSALWKNQIFRRGLRRALEFGSIS